MDLRMTLLLWELRTGCSQYLVLPHVSLVGGMRACAARISPNTCIKVHELITLVLFSSPCYRRSISICDESFVDAIGIERGGLDVMAADSIVSDQIVAYAEQCIFPQHS